MAGVSLLRTTLLAAAIAVALCAPARAQDKPPLDEPPLTPVPPPVMILPTPAPARALPQDWRVFYVGRSNMPSRGPYTIFNDLGSRSRSGESVDYWTIYFFDRYSTFAGIGMAGMIMNVTVDCGQNRYRVNASYALLSTGMTMPLSGGSGAFQSPDPGNPGDRLELRTACEWRAPPANLTFGTLMEAALFAREQRATPI